ncbi:hypothetical protein J1N10_11700 [Carboxylicivirga sp. A043]|uniref:hypothetical protein n=1 Tax=Carboxylicivirga litoralis TaxID=2816963 RepID=UPI0021CB92F3|nr:hypothetical protein [Carboxylicivirga sp. A043]MCU4156642.1 hypothetical protein [Carboxylicivirga sp. A043]
MKKSLLILLALVSLIASSGDSFILLVFKMNQQYIAENLCEQKEVKNNTCQGCCHLKKQMEQQNEQDKTSPEPTKRKLLIDFFNDFRNPYKALNTSKSISYCVRTHLSLQAVHADIFHPPRH